MSDSRMAALKAMATRPSKGYYDKNKIISDDENVETKTNNVQDALNAKDNKHYNQIQNDEEMDSGRKEIKAKMEHHATDRPENESGESHAGLNNDDLQALKSKILELAGTRATAHTEPQNIGLVGRREQPKALKSKR
jgi:hypothetical protein